MRIANARGETSLTVLIAVGLVAASLVYALSSLTGVVKTNRRALAPPNICREVAQNILNNIRSNGLQANAARTPIDSASVALNDANWHAGGHSYQTTPIVSEVGALATLGGPRWPARPVIEWQSGSPPYRTATPLVVQSSINALLSIYNQPGNTACQNAAGVAVTLAGPLRDIASADQTDLHEVRASMRIRPYDINTGAVLACATPLGLRPYAISEPPPAQQRGMLDFSEFRADRGLEVEVFVETRPTNTDEPGNPVPTRCSVKERFQYDRENYRPPAPTVTFSGSTITFDMSPTTHDPGTHLFCRAMQNYFGAFNGEATRAVSGFTSDPSWPAPDDWVPCDRMQICGSAGTTSVDRAAGRIRKSYSIPDECIFSIEAMTVDWAGNLSDVQPANYYGNPQVPDPYTPSESSDPTQPGGYQVGGLQFATKEAARIASSISKLPIIEIGTPTRPRDAEVVALGSSLSGTTNARDDAASANGAARSALGQAQAALNAANGASNSGSAFSAAGNADAAAAAAGNAATAANQAAAAAYNSYQQTIDRAGNLGALGAAAVEQAKAAYEEAKKQAEEAYQAYLEALKAAEEARRRAEELKRQEEEDDDDDDDKN